MSVIPSTIALNKSYRGFITLTPGRLSQKINLWNTLLPGLFTIFILQININRAESNTDYIFSSDYGQSLGTETESGPKEVKCFTGSLTTPKPNIAET